MSVPPQQPPTDPHLRLAWNELFREIKRARETFAAAGAELTVHIKVKQKKP